MIEEIRNPSPSIYDIIEHKKLINRIKRKTKTKLGIYDVAFNSDYSLIEEFSEKCNVDKDFALSFITIFFEEIKKGMMEGKVIGLLGFGKFYVNGPHKGTDGKTILPSNKSRIFPKFKLSIVLKQKFKNSQ